MCHHYRQLTPCRRQLLSTAPIEQENITTTVIDKTLQTILDQSPIGVAITRTGLDNRPLFFNRRALRELGYSEDEYLDLTTPQLYASQQEREELLARYAHDGQVENAEVTLLVRNGTPRQVLISLYPLAIDDETCTLAWVFDITEQKQREQHHSAIIKAMKEGVVVHARDGTITTANQAAADMLGLTLAQLQGKSSLDPDWYVIHEDGSPFPGEEHPSMQTLSSGAPQQGVVMGIHKPGGGLTWLEVDSAPLSNNGELYGAVVSFRDITAARQARQELLSSEQRLQSIIDNMIDTYYRVDSTGKVLQASPSLLELLGYHPDEVIGKNIADYYYEPAERDEFLRSLQEAGGKLRGHQTRLRNKDGYLIWVSTSAHFTYDEAGNISGIEGTTQDISDRKATEQALRDSEARYRRLAEYATDMISHHDESGRYLYLSPACTTILGYLPEELIGRDSYELFHPDDVERIKQSHHDVLEHRNNTISYRLRHKDGHYVWLESSVTWFDAGPNQEIIVVSRDISARRAAEQALRDSQSRLSQAEAIAGLGSWEWEVESDTTRWSDQAFRNSGYEPGSVEPSFDLFVKAIHPEDRQKVMDIVHDVMSSGDSFAFEYRVIWPDGTVRHLANQGEVIRDAEGKPQRVVGAAQDITDRKEAEQALAVSEERFRTIFTLAPFGAGLSDPEGRLINTNRTMQEMFGYSDEEFRGMHFADYTVSEDIAKNVQFFEELKAGERDFYQMEKRYRRKDGRVFWGNLAVSAIRHSDGSLKSAISMVEDITERKEAQAEQSRLHQQLQQAQKMESIGQLTGGIAHDFNNILAAILGYSELAAMQIQASGSEKLATYLQQINESGLRAKELIAQMLAFSRKQATEPRALDTRSTLNDITGLIKGVLPSSIELIYEVPDGLPAIWADPAQLHQVVLNLVINARDALEGKGQITIQARQEQLSGSCASCHTDYSGCYVDLSIRDSAGSIRADTLDKIFDPFFTTKAVGRGTGMGLSLVHGNVHSWGGHIRVDVEPGHYTEVHVLLDCQSCGCQPHTAHSRGDGVSGEEALPQASTEATVMVVDDERALGQFIGDFLALKEIRREIFTDSEEALAAFAAAPDHYQLVITDQTMPRLTGLELARELRKIRPRLPIIISSGYSEAINDITLARQGINAFLSKPIEATTLLKLVTELLSGDSGRQGGE